MLATVGDIASFVKWGRAHWAPETIWHKQTGKCGSVEYTFVDVALHNYVELFMSSDVEEQSIELSYDLHIYTLTVLSGA